MNDEDIHGPWDKESQRYEDGCKSGDTHPMTTDSVPAHNEQEKLIEALFYEQDDGRHVFAFIDPRATLEDDPYLEEMLTRLSSLLSTARTDGLNEASEIAHGVPALNYHAVTMRAEIEKTLRAVVPLTAEEKS